MAWRNVLGTIYAEDCKVSIQDLLKRAQAGGIKTNVANIRARARDFAARGYLEGSISDGFYVTANAASRFGFVRKNSGINEL
jgi:hypothetical protein